MCKSKQKNTADSNPNSNIPVGNQAKVGPVNPNASGVQQNSAKSAGMSQLAVNQGEPIRQSKIVAPSVVSAQSLVSVTVGGNTNVPIDRKLQKSQVHVKQVHDPTVQNFFKDCMTQRIQLTKVTKEHNTYVRNYDYFDVSNGHYRQLENIKPAIDPKLAMYGVTESSSLSTPTINKFVYNQNVVDVGYVPKNAAYTNKYQLVTEQQLEAVRNQFAYSDVQPVLYANNKPVIPGYNGNVSSVRPYADTNNLTYNQQYSNASQPQPSYGASQGYSLPGTSQGYNYQPGTSQSYNLPASGTSQGYYPTSGPSQTSPQMTSSTVQPLRLNTSQQRSNLAVV